MRVRVLQEYVGQPGQMDVRVASDYGEVIARWMSGSPVAPGEYEVEWEIPGTLEWGRSAIVSSESGPSIYSGPQGIRICGILENVMEFGVVAIRLGPAMISAE